MPKVRARRLRRAERPPTERQRHGQGGWQRQRQRWWCRRRRRRPSSVQEAGAPPAILAAQAAQWPRPPWSMPPSSPTRPGSRRGSSTTRCQPRADAPVHVWGRGCAPQGPRRRVHVRGWGPRAPCGARPPRWQRQPGRRGVMGEPPSVGHEAGGHGGGSPSGSPPTTKGIPPTPRARVDRSELGPPPPKTGGRLQRRGPRAAPSRCLHGPRAP